MDGRQTGARWRALNECRGQPRTPSSATPAGSRSFRTNEPLHTWLVNQIGNPSRLHVFNVIRSHCRNVNPTCQPRLHLEYFAYQSCRRLTTHVLDSPFQTTFECLSRLHTYIPQGSASINHNASTIYLYLLQQNILFRNSVNILTPKTMPPPPSPTTPSLRHQVIRIYKGTTLPLPNPHHTPTILTSTQNSSTSAAPTRSATPSSAPASTAPS